MKAADYIQAQRERYVSIDDGFDRKVLLRGLGSLVYQARTRAQWHIEDLAERAGITVSQARAVEAGRGGTPERNTEACLRALEFPLREMGLEFDFTESDAGHSIPASRLNYTPQAVHFLRRGISLPESGKNK